MVKKAAEGGHHGAEYVLAIISIFEGGISIKRRLDVHCQHEKKHASNSEKMSTPFAMHFKSNVGART